VEDSQIEQNQVSARPFSSPEPTILLTCDRGNLVPRANSSTIFKMADRPEKALAKAELTPLLIGGDDGVDGVDGTHAEDDVDDSYRRGCIAVHFKRC